MLATTWSSPRDTKPKIGHHMLIIFEVASLDI